MANRHYTEEDFINTSTYRDSSGYGCQKGYCRVCGGDMQRFLKNGEWDFVRHYNSHGNGGVKRALPKKPKTPRPMTALEKILNS